MPDSSRQEGTINHYFAYPIEYQGEKCYVFCRAIQDANTNRLYVHEVFVGDKIKKGDTLQTAAFQPHGGIALYRGILGNVLNAKIEEKSGTDKKPINLNERDDSDIRFSIRKEGSKGADVMVEMAKATGVTVEIVTDQEAMVKKENPELWAQGKELMKETQLWEEVKNDPNYADIHDDEDAIASEVHSRLTGEEGARIMEDMIRDSRNGGAMKVAETVTLVERIKGWFKDMFKNLKQTLDKWTKRDLEDLTLEEFNRMTIRDFAEGLDPRHGDRTDTPEEPENDTNDRPGRGAYTDNEVSVYNDLISRIEGKSRFSKKRQAEWAAKERQRMAKRISELAEKLHIDNIDILTDGSGLEGKRASAKGFFNRRTGKITIVIPNHLSMIDAEQTLLHEAVAHYGLRKLFGEHFEDFLDNVYEAADPEIRRKIAEMAAQNGWDFRTATEEYLAGLAEETDFEYAYEEGWWQQIKRLFVKMLNKVGFKGFMDSTGIVLTDNELRYMLWISYQNLKTPGSIKDFWSEAENVAKQYEMRVGNYAESGITADYAAEPGEAEEVNNRFNHELQQQIEGKLSPEHVYQLGYPGSILKAAGFPNKPIELSSSHLAKKAKQSNHKYSIEDIKDLPKALQNPIAVFEYGDRNKSENVIVGLDKDGKQFVVGVHFNQNRGGIEVSSIRGLYPKDNAEWLNWISQGKAQWMNKEKIQTLINQQQKNLADVKYLDLDLTTKLIKDFENPTIEEEELFRPGDFSPRDKVLARDTYERMVGKGGYQFQEAVQDSMLGLKKLYQAILGKKTRIEDVAGFENAYLYENRMSSMNAGEQHEYFVRFMEPLLEEIGRICGANKRKRRELTDYIMAKHGLERNEYMRNEAATNGERTDRDFAGLIGLTGEADWQAAEDVARQWVDDYEDMYDTTDLWEAINNATKATLEKVYTAGIISKDTFEKVSTMYQYYVPLRGWDETTSDEVYGYLTSPNGPLNGSIVKRAEGRESMADDPIATIGMMADDAIRQGNRNLMKQRFLNFVMNHPSDAVSVHDIWLEHDDVTDEWNPVFADIKETDTPEQIAQKIEDFENLMETLKAAEPDKYKRRP